MAFRRTSVQDFSLGNELYAGATVSFYTVDGNGAATATLATLYAALTGATTLLNPQTLDSLGKFLQPVYIEVPVIMTVTGLASVPTHSTGVVYPSLSDADATAAAAAAVTARAAATDALRNSGVGRPRTRDSIFQQSRA